MSNEKKVVRKPKKDYTKTQTESLPEEKDFIPSAPDPDLGLVSGMGN